MISRSPFLRAFSRSHTGDLVDTFVSTPFSRYHSSVCLPCHRRRTCGTRHRAGARSFKNAFVSAGRSYGNTSSSHTIVTRRFSTTPSMRITPPPPPPPPPPPRRLTTALAKYPAEFSADDDDPSLRHSSLLFCVSFFHSVFFSFHCVVQAFCVFSNPNGTE